MKPLHDQSDEEFIATARRALASLTDAPAAWQQAALGLWPAAPALWARAAGAVLRRLTAILSFDSWAQPVLGMRSASAATRHLLYSVDGRDIDLRIAATGDVFALAGQVLGPDEEGVVELAAEGPVASVAHLAWLDGLGEFRIAGVSGGRYHLTLRLGADEIVLPAIDVGEHRR